MNAISNHFSNGNWTFAPISQRNAPPPGEVFFAINPDAEGAERCDRLAHRVRAERNLRGVPLAPEHLHVALFPIGYFPELPVEAIEVSDAVASQVAAITPRFELMFDRVMSLDTGCPRQPLVLLGDEGAAGVTLLRQGLLTALQRIGVRFETMPPYQPHMTLLYDDRRVPELRVEPVRWVARKFVLIHSHCGHARQIHLKRWRLEG
jgi:2'-5' RNA ligase